MSILMVVKGVKNSWLNCEGTLIHEDKMVGEDYPIPVLCWWWLPRNVDSSTLKFQNANC